MADLRILYEGRGDAAIGILAKAAEYAETHPLLTTLEIQNVLKVGHKEATVILDWLADSGKTNLSISNHWIRAGRTYVLNNPTPCLSDMCVRLKVGEQRGYAIMRELEKTGLIRVNHEFYFIRNRKMHTFKQMVRQMQCVAKKYGGRCEFALLERTLYIDPVSAFRLAQYGEEYLGLYWKNKNDWVR